MDVVINPSTDNSSNNQTNNDSNIPEKVPSNSQPTNSEPTNIVGENKNSQWLPTWSYAAIGGGVAAVGITGAIVYGVVSKKKRIAQARADAKELYLRQQGGCDFTPRDNKTPDNKAENNKGVVTEENRLEDTGLL
jgi:hypothetical protein